MTEDGVGGTAVVNALDASRLIRSIDLDDSLVILAELIRHDSRLRFW
jgi:hypothetical protein